MVLWRRYDTGAQDLVFDSTMGLSLTQWCASFSSSFPTTLGKGKGLGY